ncbi:hypothetical protein D3879_16275 [Pseudomonas cavernicola]|uniref:Uncharacterized protein n=1 Tax=Pseudomonas cavernicola TaxID=2320866 RepID=A0A418XAV3_9PSED|nr:hypothetical protein [Pseudomonas cavernicola]RJG09632.1 hypothetical protein D3879_16275 [Pseudomonas cavernicola]
MAGFVDALIAQVLRLEINLQACRARLVACTDLAPRVADWRLALAAAELLADQALLPLHQYFPGR